MFLNDLLYMLPEMYSSYPQYIQDSGEMIDGHRKGLYPAELRKFLHSSPLMVFRRYDLNEKCSTSFQDAHPCKNSSL